MGETDRDSQVTVNGAGVDIAPDGAFQRDVALKGELNLIDVMATGPSGHTRSKGVRVFVVAPAISWNTDEDSNSVVNYRNLR